MTEIQEAINVWVFFEKNFIKPYSFFWRGRQIKIEQINLVHTSKSGSSVFYHFSVSAGDNFYRITLDSSKMKWILEALDDSSY